MFIYSIASRPARGPNWPPIQWEQGTISLGIERQGREASLSPPSSFDVKKDGATPPLSHISLWCSKNVKLQKDGESGVFTSLTLCILRPILLRSTEEVWRVCSRHGLIRNAYKIFVGNLK
jgi:hypothetical protein